MWETQEYFREFSRYNALISRGCPKGYRYAVRDEAIVFSLSKRRKDSRTSARERKVAARFIGTGANLLRPILCNVPLADVYSMPRKINGPTWNGLMDVVKFSRCTGKRLARLIRPPWFYLDRVSARSSTREEFHSRFFYKFLREFLNTRGIFFFFFFTIQVKPFQLWNIGYVWIMWNLLFL